MAIKVRYCNQETIQQSLAILQPVTPTDDAHRAEWYNEEFGKQIMFAQNSHIKALKQLLKDCNTHKEISEVFRTVGIFPKWPTYIMPVSKEDISKEAFIQSNHEFWTEDIGKTIRKDYQTMLQKFIDEINSLK